MKKLAILTSLAVLVAPSFTGSNAFSDLSKNQIKMVEGGETSSTVNPTIVFGTTTTDEKETDATKLNARNIFKNFEDYVQPTFSSATKCYGTLSDSALKIGASSSAGSIVLNFETSQIVKDIVLTAKAYNIKKTPTITVTSASDDGTELISENNTHVFSTTSFESWTCSGLDGGNGTASKTIEISSSKYAWISQIEFVFETSTTATVTYDYGTSVENSDFNTKSVEVDKGETVTSPLTDEYTYTDWDGTRKLVGWYTDEEKAEAFDFTTQITKDMTLYAKWEVITDSTEVTNIKTSETKSQLYYEYGKTPNPTIYFGEKENTSGANISQSTASNYYKCVNLPTSAELEFSGCYGGGTRTNDNEKSNYALRTKNGSITITFDSATYVREMIVYARGANKDDGAILKAISKDNDNNTISESTNTIKVGTEGTFDQYFYKNIDGAAGGKYSKTITLSNTDSKRTFISKIEFVIANEVESTSTTYSVSNIGLRFGGLVKQSYYDALKDHITNFGLIYATDLGDHETLTDALKDETFKNQTEYSEDATKGNVPYLTDIDGEKYYVFNAFFNVSTESINTVIYAIATLKFDNGTTIYFSEKSNSVVTIAKEYLATDAYDGLVKETLTALSNGKTVTESN